MPRFRLILILLIFAALVAIMFVKHDQVSQLWTFSYCEQPITYSIGELDPRFGLTPAEFTAAASGAAQIWNTAIGKNLITQASSPAAQVSVNFVFDGKQGINTQITTQQTQVEKDQALLTKQRAAYQQQLTDFKKRAANFNAQVKATNDAGGAKPDQFETLTNLQQQLQKEADQLNAQASKLNMSAQQFNAAVGSLNQTIDQFNGSLTEKPEEGIYDGAHHRIEVYLNKDPKQVVHTLAHEFGHALRLEHNQNKQSIMYYLSSGSLKPSQEDLADLQKVCQTHTGWEAFQLRIQSWRDSLIPLVSTK